MSSAPIVAAGAAVLRRGRAGQMQVLLVHGAKWDDWSLPKGKLDPGESTRAAAVREVQEETGVEIRLGPPLPAQVYAFRDRAGIERTKVVHYWVGHARGEDDVSAFRANDEITEVRWVDLEEAGRLLDHRRDEEVLEQARSFERRTRPLVVLRHADALPRDRWRGNDRRRGLTSAGKTQAERLVPLLAAYGVTRVVTSSSTRSVDTVTPYAAAANVKRHETDALSEEDATRARVRQVLETCEGRPALLCTHRPVLPVVFRALGVEQGPVEKGGFVVVHRRGSRVAAVERVPAPSRGSSDWSGPG